jgi:hypothetical protein
MGIVDYPLSLFFVIIFLLILADSAIKILRENEQSPDVALERLPPFEYVCEKIFLQEMRHRNG